MLLLSPGATPLAARRASHATAVPSHTKAHAPRSCGWKGLPGTPARHQFAPRAAASLPLTAPPAPGGGASWWGDPAAASTALHTPPLPPWRLGPDMDPGLASLLAAIEGAWVAGGAVGVVLDEVR